MPTPSYAYGYSLAQWGPKCKKNRSKNLWLYWGYKRRISNTISLVIEVSSEKVLELQLACEIRHRRLFQSLNDFLLHIKEQSFLFSPSHQRPARKPEAYGAGSHYLHFRLWYIIKQFEMFRLSLTRFLAAWEVVRKVVFTFLQFCEKYVICQTKTAWGCKKGCCQVK